MTLRLFILFQLLLASAAASAVEAQPEILDQLVSASSISTPSQKAIIRKVKILKDNSNSPVTFRDVVTHFTIWTLYAFKPELTKPELVEFLDRYGLRVEMSEAEIYSYVHDGQVASPSIDSLGLSRAALRSLYLFNVKTLADLRRVSITGLRKHVGTGVATIHEIRLALRKLGISPVDEDCNDRLEGP